MEQGVEAKGFASRSEGIQPSLFGGMVLAGIATTMLGPLLPRLAPHWQIGDASAGLLFTALFLASVVTGALVGPLAQRFGHRRLIRGGLVLGGAGVAMLALSSWPQAIGAMAMIGAGLGLCVPAANLGVTGPRAVMLVNFAWSIGAVSGPWLIVSFPDGFLWSLSAAMACAAAMTVRPLTQAAAATRGAKATMSTATVLTAIFVFAYVGVESSLDGWLSSYASRNSDARSLPAALPSVFWVGILTGRLLAAQALRHLVPASLLGGCLVLAFAGTCLLHEASRPWLLLAATALTGLGIAPVFPLAVASYSDVAKTEKAAGLIFAAGGLGGASVPALVGAVSERSGELHVAMAIPPALIVVMILLWKTSSLGQRPQQQDAPADAGRPMASLQGGADETRGL